MIEGIQVTIGGVELRKLCFERVKEHCERAEKYRLQIASMKQAAIEGMSYTNGDPVRALEDKLESHESDASEMSFIADHLDVHETYLLCRDDLRTLGIVRSRY